MSEALEVEQIVCTDNIKNEADEVIDAVGEIDNDEQKNDENEAVEEKEAKIDADSYLNRDEFTSERYKIEIQNLPRIFGFGQLKKYLASLKLDYVKVKSPGKGNYAFVTFRNEEAKQNAMKIVNETTYKGKLLRAIPAKPAADPSAAIANHDAVRKRRTEDENESVKKSKSEDSNLPLEERVQNSVAPLWKLSYEEQLKKKSDVVKSILRKIREKIFSTNPSVQSWLLEQKKKYEGMCCEFVDYVPSPVQDGYRNKCEFSFGYNVDESDSLIGFRLGDFKSGSNEVVSPDACPNISSEMKTLVQAFKTYLHEKSSYKAFNVRNHEGNWRQLTLRSNQSNEFLAILVFEKKELTEDELKAEKDKLVEFVSNLKFENFKLISLFFSTSTKRTGASNAAENIEKLYGDDYLYEKLMDLNFRISPLAFFQANTKGAELLYNRIGDLCNVDKGTIVLDICCGTGTIGLTLARRAKFVVGVEIIAQAIEDAKINSKINNISNVEFICGKAEEVLQRITKRYEKEKIVAIVDPPRAGLHNKVIQTLRQLQNLDTLIYVSCNAELALGNFVDFARPTSKNYKFEPFVPVKALGVDMFPHTNHYELVLYLQRYKAEFLPKNE